MKGKKSDSPKREVFSREKIRAALTHGELIHIADITGYTREYVSDVLNSRRDSETILQVAMLYAHYRDLDKERLKGKYHRDQLQQEYEAA